MLAVEVKSKGNLIGKKLTIAQLWFKAWDLYFSSDVQIIFNILIKLLFWQILSLFLTAMEKLQKSREELVRYYSSADFNRKVGEKK